MVLLSAMLAFIVCLCSSTAAYALIATGKSGSNAQAVHALGDIGAGVNVGLVSAGNTRITHEAFKDVNGVSHAFADNATNDDAGYTPTNHDTWIAGVIASRGTSAHPNDIGVAPGVNLYDERVVTITGGSSTQFIETALNDLVNNHNCHIILTGLQLTGSGSPPDGTSPATLIYDYYANTYNVFFANAAGNYQYDSNNVLISKNISVFGDAYNGLTTGGLAVVEPNVWRLVGSVSNLGPTADGRRKPDVVAPSQNQTVPTGTGDTDWKIWDTAGGETSF